MMHPDLNLLDVRRLGFKELFLRRKAPRIERR